MARWVAGHGFEAHELMHDRKIIQCATSRQDYAAAREAYGKMTESGRDEPKTRYLMYKVALQSADMELGKTTAWRVFSDILTATAAESLEHICKNSANDATLLYASVMEAQNIGTKDQVIYALERVLEKHDYGAPIGIHLPALLR